MCFAVGNQLVLSTAAALETTRNAFFFFWCLDDPCVGIAFVIHLLLQSRPSL